MRWVSFTRAEYVEDTGDRRADVRQAGTVTFRAADVVEVADGPFNPLVYSRGMQGQPERLATVRVRGDTERVLVYATRENVLEQIDQAHKSEEAS